MSQTDQHVFELGNLDGQITFKFIIRPKDKITNPSEISTPPVEIYLDRRANPFRAMYNTLPQEEKL